MAGTGEKPSRIRDVDRDSKILRGIPSKPYPMLDTFSSEAKQVVDGLRHHLNYDHRRVGRDLPRTTEDGAVSGFTSSFNEYDSGFHGCKEMEDPFHGFYRRHGGLIYKFKKNLPDFDGFWHPEDLMSWIDAIEDLFEEINPPEHVKCKIVWYKMKGAAYYWWKTLQQDRFSEGKSLISSWPIMKRLLLKRFRPVSCSTKDIEIEAIATESINKDDDGSVAEQSKEGLVVKPAKCSIKALTESKTDRQGGLSDSEFLYTVGEDASKDSNELQHYSNFVAPKCKVSCLTNSVDGFEAKGLTAYHEIGAEYEDANTIKALSTSSQVVPIKPSILEAMIHDPLVTSLINKGNSECGTGFNNAYDEQHHRRIRLELTCIDVVIGKILVLSFDPGGAKTNDSSGQLQQALLAQNEGCVEGFCAADSIRYHEIDMKLECVDARAKRNGVILHFVKKMMEFFRNQEYICKRYALHIALHTGRMMFTFWSFVSTHVPYVQHHTSSDNIHGHLYELLDLFVLKDLSSLRDNRHTFNDEFVDKSSVSVSRFVFKYTCPRALYILRGKCESKNLKTICGFRGEVKHTLSETFVVSYTRDCCLLPLKQFIDNEIFVLDGSLMQNCVPGGDFYMLVVLLRSWKNSVLMDWTKSRWFCKMELNSLRKATTLMGLQGALDGKGEKIGPWSSNMRMEIKFAHSSVISLCLLLQISHQFLTPIDIGNDNNSTVVLERNYGGCEVAVEILVKTHNDVPSTRNTSDQHCMNLSWQRFQCSLHDLLPIYTSSNGHITSVGEYTMCSGDQSLILELNVKNHDESDLSKRNGYHAADLIKFMKNEIHGIDHLRELSIVHRNLSHYVLALFDGDVLVSDPLTILLYLEEKYPEKRLLTCVQHFIAMYLQATSIGHSSIQHIRHMTGVLTYMVDNFGSEGNSKCAVNSMEKRLYALDKLLKKFAGKYAIGQEISFSIDQTAKSFNCHDTSHPTITPIIHYKCSVDLKDVNPVAFQIAFRIHLVPTSNLHFLIVVSMVKKKSGMRYRLPSHVAELANASYKDRADTHRREQILNVGDLVMVFMRKERCPTGTYHKWKSKKVDPFPIVMRFSNNAYEVDLPNDGQVPMTINVADINVYHAPDDAPTEHAQIEDEFVILGSDGADAV